MVSTKTSRVSGRIAASTGATSVASTNVTSLPCAASVLNRLLVLPNRERAGHDVIAVAQKRQHDRADRRHAGAEADGCDAVLHPIHFFLERGGGRVAPGARTRSPALLPWNTLASSRASR
mgnify:CR=1 FL=1